MTQEPLNAKKLREQCWRERIAVCASSGKTVAQWCRDEGIAVALYHWWKGEIKRRDRAHAVTPVFAELRPAPVSFIPASPLEVVLSGERLVRVHPGFDAATLSSVVRVLEGLESSGGA